jgi:predicted lipid-binding transport protein (Tim44 family)
MQSGFDMTTLVFIVLAAFVGWRLWSVLGTKTGHEQPPVDPFAKRDGKPGDAGPAAGPVNPPDNVIRLPGAANDVVRPAADRWAGVTEPGTPLANGLDAIASVERDFDVKSFLAGAKSAYEMIVLAFARGDRQALKGLLAKEVYDGFEAEIRERESRGEKVETTFVSLDMPVITAVDVKDKTAQVTMRFASKLITATKDKAGVTIDGSSEQVVDVADEWTFSRQLGSRDPAWWLVATDDEA